MNTTLIVKKSTPKRHAKTQLINLYGVLQSHCHISNLPWKISNYLLIEECRTQSPYPKKDLRFRGNLVCSKRGVFFPMCSRAQSTLTCSTPLPDQKLLYSPLSQKNSPGRWNMYTWKRKHEWKLDPILSQLYGSTNSYSPTYILSRIPS